MRFPEVVCEDGLQKIILNKEHVEDFNKLIQFVRNQKIGAREGVFKMEFHPTLESDSAADEVRKAVISHFSVQGDRPSRQCFFYGSEKDDIYGYKEMLCSDKDAEYFARIVMDPNSFLNPETCCTRDFYSFQDSADQLVEHYWNIIRNKSVMSAGIEMLPDQSEQKVSADEDLLSPAQSTSPDMDWLRNMYTSQESMSHQPSILYCAGILLPYTGFASSENFSLSTLGTILDVCNKSCPQLTLPRFYIGLEHSTFPWHVEDGVLWSINFLHCGASKVWFVVPAEYYDLFVYHLSQLPLDISHVTCCNILRHSYVVMSHFLLQRLGVPVCVVIQRPRQFVVTYPYAAHSGFNMGPNVAEAVNFGDDKWVELGVTAPKCICLKRSQVNLRMSEIIAVARPHLLDVYLARNPSEMIEAFPQPRYLQLKFASTYALSVEETVNLSGPQVNNAKLLHETETSLREECNVRTVSNTSDGPEEDVESKYVFCGARGMLKCPECDQTYKEGRSKLHRLLNHARKKHSKSCPKLLDEISSMYPPKKKTSSYMTCKECGKSFSGNLFHLKLHHTRLHSNKTFKGSSN